MKSVRARVYLEDECPRIGCGWRTVDIKTGRKWVYFVDPFSGRRQRIAKAKAEPILRSIPVPHEVRTG